MDEVDRELELAETQANEYEPQYGTLNSESAATITAKTTATDLSIAKHPTHRSRWEDQLIRHTHTVGAHPTRTRREDEEPLPDFGGGKPFPPEIPAERDAYVVDFRGPDDPLHPMNWKFSKKLGMCFLGGLSCFTSTFASSVITPAQDDIAKHFHVSPVVESLTSVLFLMGYTVGPLIWAPVSELKGRKIPLIAGSLGFSIFSIGVGAAKDMQTITICRFFMGVCGSSALVVVPGFLADIFCAEQRGNALILFVCCVMSGPCVGPIIGSFSLIGLSWRLVGYWSTIMGFFTTALLLLFFDETYPPTVLVGKAQYLRRRTRNWAIHAKQEEIEIHVREMAEKNIARPLRMLIEEPILLLIGLYITFAYTLLYVSLAAVPLVFERVHHWKQGPASLPFISMIIGIALSAGTVVLLNPSWVRKYHANGNQAEPEWRLPFVCFAGIVFAIGLFWFGWTGAYESVHWIVPTIALSFIGYGIIGIFAQLISFIVDSYLMFAASAIAGNTMLRSLVAASVALYDRQMFVNMGIQWGMTLLGCFAVLLIPVPLAFIIYGPKLRKKSKWTPQPQTSKLQTPSHKSSH